MKATHTQPPAGGEAAHTPTPWTYLKRKTLCHVESLNTGEPVCSIPLAREQDAAFIVRACNAYSGDAHADFMRLSKQHNALKQQNAALVAALEKQQDRLTTLSGSCRTDDDVRSFLVVSLSENRAALQSAKE